MKLGNPNWLSEDVQARIETPPIPLNRMVAETVKECDITRIKMHHDPAATDSETYKLNISMFNNVKPA